MATPRLEPGALFRERYRLETPLGRGGMGEVWRALDERLRRTVAIKVLRSDVARDPSCADRFRREAVATARVSHPNLVGIFDMDFDHEPPFIAMEFLDGPTLARELKKGAFTEARALAVAEQSLRALAALHAVGIVHRDIKPGNIMLVSAGGIETTKVVDLGIAQLMTGTVYQRLTSTGAIIGTPAYMAPEMLDGATATAACDVWAIGIVVFALLTGRKAFADADLAELVQSVLDPAPAPDVRTLAPLVSQQTATFVGALLEKSIHRRPANASEALQLLEQLRHAPRPVEPRQSFEPRTLQARQVDHASAVTRSAGASPPRRLLLGVVAGFAFLIVGVALLGFGVAAYASRARTESPAAPAPAVQLSAVPAPPSATTDAVPSTPTVSPASDIQLSAGDSAPPSNTNPLPGTPVVVASNAANSAASNSAASNSAAPNAPAASHSLRRVPPPGREPARQGGATNGFTSASEPSSQTRRIESPYDPAPRREDDVNPRTQMTSRLSVVFDESASRIRSSFEAHTNNLSSQCHIASRPSGTPFARFLVSRGHVTRMGGPVEASMQEVNCVMRALSEVDWDGSTYHFTLNHSYSR